MNDHFWHGFCLGVGVTLAVGIILISLWLGG